jgi:hypothetical protein
MTTYNKLSICIAGIMICAFVYLTIDRRNQAAEEVEASETKFHAWLRFSKSDLRKAVEAVEGSDTLGITQICLDDYNRIMQTSFTKQTMSPSEIFYEYPEYWINRFEIPNTPENYARIWNGGPRGYQKTATKEYWRIVQITMEAQRNEVHR